MAHGLFVMNKMLYETRIVKMEKKMKKLVKKLKLEL